MKQILPIIAGGVLAIVVLLGVIAASPLESNVGTTLRFEASREKLVADGVNEVTLVAYLNTDDGEGLDGERVRFVIGKGSAQFMQSVDGEADANGPVSSTAVDALNVGNGIYVARLRANEIAGDVDVTAQWLTAPDRSVPNENVSLEVVTAERLNVRVDDRVVLADGEDTSTVVAYVLDGLGRPVENANVTFRIVEGPGTLAPLALNGAREAGSQVQVDGINGRYAALYRSSSSPGGAVIEVSLPAISDPIRETVRIEAVEASRLEAVAFPNRVARLRDADSVEQKNISTVLVAARDGEGNLVTGLTGADLRGQVTSGPGNVTGPREILLRNGAGSGVYQFAFIAAETTGRSTVEFTNLKSPRRATVRVTLTTVTEVNPSVVENASLRVFADEPLYADGQNRALVFALAEDGAGNAVRGLSPEFLIINGSGRLEDEPFELENLVEGVRATSIHGVIYVAGNNGRNGDTDVRVFIPALNDRVITNTVEIDVDSLERPEVVIFPDRIPAGQTTRAIVDIYDENDNPVNFNEQSRYLIEIERGPGNVVFQPVDGGSDPDLIAGDNLNSGVFEITVNQSASQDVELAVVDRAVAGFPTRNVTLRIGDETELEAFVSPRRADAGDRVQVVVFARDEFSLPALGHELVVNIRSGSGTVLNGGRLIDDGGEVAGFRDAYANDGVYVGAIEITGTARGDVSLRITDLTQSNQPTTTVNIDLD